MTTQNLALDISSVKLQIASVTKLHPKASPAYPTVWGALKQAPSCSEKQHCALSKAKIKLESHCLKALPDQNTKVTGLHAKSLKISFSEQKLLLCGLGSPWQKPTAHDLCLIMKWMARVMCWPGTRNWGRTSPGSFPAAAQLPGQASFCQHPTAAARRKWTGYAGYK